MGVVAECATFYSVENAKEVDGVVGVAGRWLFVWLYLAPPHVVGWLKGASISTLKMIVAADMIGEYSNN